MPSLKLEVTEVKLETPSIVSVRLSLGGQSFPFKPGQYCLVSIPVGDRTEDHALSIASSPTRGDSILFSTRRSESSYKNAFFSLKPGDLVSVMGPMGQFILDDNSPVSVLLSGGIGITPLKSMVEFAADMKLERRIILFFGNRSPDEIPFYQPLVETSQSNPNIEIVHVISGSDALQKGWTGPTGQIGETLIRKFVDAPAEARYFICGPPGMVSGLIDVLEKLNVAKDRINFENFNGYT